MTVGIVTVLRSVWRMKRDDSSSEGTGRACGGSFCLCDGSACSADHGGTREWGAVALEILKRTNAEDAFRTTRIRHAGLKPSDSCVTVVALKGRVVRSSFSECRRTPLTNSIFSRTGTGARWDRACLAESVCWRGNHRFARERRWQRDLHLRWREARGDPGAGSGREKGSRRDALHQS